MPIERDDPTLSPAWLATLATGTTGQDISDVRIAERARLPVEVIDAIVPPRPKLLVPIDVQALVVGPDDDGLHVDVSVTTMARMADGSALADGDDTARAAAPFAEPEERAPGVHLHWAMPDGLTQGTTSGEGADSEVHLRPLPDRWVVCRIEAGVPHPVTAWVVESDRGRAVPLADWPAAPGDDDPFVHPEDLNAMTGGDAAWAAVYDNVTNRFAFHDPLTDRATDGILSYLVVGWFSDADLDPLAAIRGPGNVSEVLDALRWQATELDAALEAWEEEQRTRRWRGDLVETATTAKVAAALSSELRKGVFDGVGAADRPAPIIQSRVWYPGQSLYHGRVEGVDPSGRGADRRPRADQVHVAIGPTGAESHAALVADLHGTSAEQLQSTFMFGLLGELDQHDGAAALDEEAHRRGFASRDGGVILETVLDGDRFAPTRGGDRPTRSRPKGGFGGRLRDDLLDAIAAGEPVFLHELDRDVRDLLDDRVVRDVVTKLPPGGGDVVGGGNLGGGNLGGGNLGGGNVVGGGNLGGGNVVGGGNLGGGNVGGGGNVVGGGNLGGGNVGGRTVGGGGSVVGGGDVLGGRNLGGGLAGDALLGRLTGGVTLDGGRLLDLGAIADTGTHVAEARVPVDGTASFGAGPTVVRRLDGDAALHGGVVGDAAHLDLAAALTAGGVASAATASALSAVVLAAGTVDAAGAAGTQELRVVDAGVKTWFTAGGREGLLIHPTLRERMKTLLPGAAKGDGVLTPRTISRPAPRWFRPQDPILTLEGCNRSLRAGFDGRFGADEPLLACRLSGGEQHTFARLLTGAEVVDRVLRRTGIPREAQALLDEAVLADDHFVRDHAFTVERSTRRLSSVEAEPQLRAEARLSRWTGGVEAQPEALLQASRAVGRAPSPIGVTYWQQPWVPLYVEWEVALHHEADGSRVLEELDFPPPAALPADPEVLTGRSLLTSAAAKSFAKAAREFLADEEERGGAGSLLSTSDESQLAALASDAERTDRLVAGLDGLLDHALGFTGNEAIVADGGDEPQVHPSRAPDLLRSGALVVRRLRLVDAFGRFLDLDPDEVDVAQSVKTELTDADGRPAMDLPPRVVADTRLWVRFVDVADPHRDALLDQRSAANGGQGRSPVAGWLLPDHLDRSLEVFDPDGLPLGQLRHATLGGAVVWDGAPGSDRSVGALPTDAEVGPVLAGFATGLAARDAAELAGTAASSDEADTAERESPLSALLRAVDTTLWTVDPFGDAGDEHLSLLLGHPIAVVRARVTLDVRRDTADYVGLDPAVAAAREAAYDELMTRPFEVRLGALTRVQDGLLGWFADDDYQVFHPVHPSVLAEAQSAGLQASVGDDTRIDPITSPYATPDATLTLHPGETRWLTLLLSPAGRLHATAGIVPRKSVGLLRDWTATALARIAPSFRVGPVLVDPSTLRMPRPTTGGAWSWVQRGTPTTWTDNPLLPSSTDALLPDRDPVLQEGWLRVTRDPG